MESEVFKIDNPCSLDYGAIGRHLKMFGRFIKPEISIDFLFGCVMTLLTIRLILLIAHFIEKRQVVLIN